MPNYRHHAEAVSTHSRPKAAGLSDTSGKPATFGFNSQPPEGGWINHPISIKVCASFNSQPPEGGWASFAPWRFAWVMFQLTAARRRLDLNQTSQNTA